MRQLLNKRLQGTPNALFCVLGAVLFLLVFYTLAYRTPLWEIWLPTNMDNDEVLYNRQVVAILTHGGPQGYFGYDESYAALGRYGGWGPFLIWAYALPGFLFGSSVSTILWCNILFGLVGLAFFARAARLSVWQMLVGGGLLVCLWMPLTLFFCGSSESLHNALVLVAVGSAAALSRHPRRLWLVTAICACGFLTISRPYAILLWAFPLVALWQEHRRARNVCLVVLVISFAVGLFNMTLLTAPYFEGLGLDLTALSMAGEGNLLGAVAYQWQHVVTQLRIVWSQLLPTLQGNIQQLGAATLGFAAMVAVTVVLLVMDCRRGRAIRWKVCALVCSLVVMLLLVGLYNVIARHLMLPCLVMLAALLLEDASRAVVYLPVLAVLLLPLNARRSSLSTYFPAMAEQMTAVETALAESQAEVTGTDPWDHTLAYAYDDGVFHGYLYAVPAGMGIEFDWNTYLANANRPIRSRYAMVGHDTAAEARLLAEGWQELVSTTDLVVYERPEGETP